jgi:glycosyltransferase involved in cell wall biosynthesis
MHVCVLTAGTFPSNERIARTGAALRAGGHAVTVCARGTGGPDHDIVEGIDVRRLPDESLYSGLRGVLGGVRYATGFVQSAWVRAAGEIDDERAIDICCVGDLALLKTGLVVGDELDVPVVADLPGVTAATHSDDGRGGRLRRYARRVFHPSWRRNRLLRKRLPDVDRLMTTCEEARAEYVRETDIDPERVAVVRETAASELRETVERARGLGFDFERAFVATVIADGVRRETLETVIVAAARAADSAADLRVLVVGDIDEEGTLDDLETLARRELAGGRVTFRAAANETAEYLAASDVCVLPERSQAPETTVPRAFFVALTLGVPVLAHRTPPLQRLLDRTGAGLCMEHDGRALTETLSEFADPDRRDALGANARAAAEGAFDSERDAERLRELYKSLLATPEPDITIPHTNS